MIFMHFNVSYTFNNYTWWTVERRMLRGAFATYYGALQVLLARPASRCRRRAYVWLMLLSFLNVAPVFRQRVDGSQHGLLR